MLITIWRGATKKSTLYTCRFFKPVWDVFTPQVPSPAAVISLKRLNDKFPKSFKKNYCIMFIPFWTHSWEYLPCISCRPLRTDPPRTLCPHGSPCCSFWRCWGFWWRCGPRRARCPCPASTRWRFSWWQRWHLQQVDEEGEEWVRDRREGQREAGRVSAFIQIQTAKHRWSCLSECSYLHFSHYCSDTMWDMKQSTSWLQSCSTTYKIWGYLGIVEDYLKVHNKNFDFNSLLLSLTRPVIHYHQLSSTHQGPWGTPRSYHWKSFSNIRSNRQASWLFFSAAFLTSSDRGGPLWMSTCGWVQNLCSKSLHLNQTRRNPIICQVSFFFPLEGVCTSHSLPPSAATA